MTIRRARAPEESGVTVRDRLVRAGLDEKYADLFLNMPHKVVHAEPRRPFREPGVPRDEVMLVRSGLLAKFKSDGSGRRQIVSLQEQIKAAQAALEGTREEVLAGARTLLDVLNAELELFTAQIRRERAVEQEVVASYRLSAATGDLSLAGLGFGDESYDPTANYRAVRNRWFGLGVDDPARLDVSVGLEQCSMKSLAVVVAQPVARIEGQ